MEKKRVSPLVYARVVRAIGLVAGSGSALDDHSDAALRQLAERLEKEFEVFSLTLHVDELKDVDSIIGLAQIVWNKIEV